MEGLSNSFNYGIALQGFVFSGNKDFKSLYAGSFDGISLYRIPDSGDAYSSATLNPPLSISTIYESQNISVNSLTDTVTFSLDKFIGFIEEQKATLYNIELFQTDSRIIKENDGRDYIIYSMKNGLVFTSSSSFSSASDYGIVYKNTSSYSGVSKYSGGVPARVNISNFTIQFKAISDAKFYGNYTMILRKLPYTFSL